jgi:hypothetical protein
MRIRRRSRSADHGSGTNSNDEDSYNGSRRRTKSVERPASAQRHGALSYDDADDDYYPTSKGKSRGGGGGGGGYIDEDADEYASSYGSKGNGNGFFGQSAKNSGPPTGHDNGHGRSRNSVDAHKANEKAYSHTLAAVSDIEKLAQKKGTNPLDERFRVLPDEAYPSTYLNREELRQEMNKKSDYFHDLRVAPRKGQEVGQLRLEILQCFGIPTTSYVRETSAYCTAVCGSHAFKTDVMPPVANPMWLCKMRRACLFPVSHAYSRLFVGVFDNSVEGSTADFVGRVVIDIARLRPGCTYDFTLPLRQSANVFTRAQQGAIRVRLHLVWKSERAAIMTYIPKTRPKFQPNEDTTIHCLDERSFRNVAHTVHGAHMPGKFSMSLLKATVREINFTRIHVMRYMRQRELHYLVYWQYPFISGFVFCAWMHSIYANTVRYLPGHFLTFLLLHLYKNYAYYGMDTALQNGFMAPTFEELTNALLYGSRKRRFIEPLNMEMDESHAVNPMEHMDAAADYEEANTDAVPLSEIAEAMRKSIRVQTHKYRMKNYKNCFLGTEAVDFLVQFGFAYSRAEAVFLGRKLARESRLFEHVARKHDFEDKHYFFQFLQYDTKKYVIKGHKAKGKTLLRLMGFYKDDGILESRAHVEFPFATGEEHPRFTVKQSLVIRSAEAKKILKEQESQQDIVDCAEFGVVPVVANEGGPGRAAGEVVNVAGDVVKAGLDVVRQGVRRASLIGGINSAAQAAKEIDGEEKEKEKPQPRPKRSLMGDRNQQDGSQFADPDDIYDQLKSRNNPTLDQLVEQQQNANLYDKYAYDSDEDVEDMIKKRNKGFIIEEKKLKKPPNQDIGKKSGGGDKSFAKTISEARHKAHGLLLHLFNDRTYTVDTHLFPPTLPEDTTERESISSNKKDKKKKRIPRMSAMQAKQEKEKEEERKKKKKMISPLDAQKDECDKILQINKYSHANPWINRVGVIVQPIVEIVQGWLSLFRAIFNLFTWQDPILSFWVGFLGPIVVLVLHLAPHRLIFGVLGIVMLGPQNLMLRLFRESRSDYQPPDFDKIVRKKKPKKEEKYDEVQFYSSEAPGNQAIKYVNVEPKQVKKIVVPDSPLKYNRFYDWPPEPEYARVYASPPPKNSLNLSKISGMSELESDDEGVSDTESYMYDANLTKREKKKKKKRGVKRLASQMKRGTGTIVFAGGELANRTRNTTERMAMGSINLTKGAVKGTAKFSQSAVKGAAKGTAKVSKNMAKGTAHVTKSAVKGTARQARGVFGLRNRKNKSQYDDDDDSGY